jgi:hypothetical protein
VRRHLILPDTQCRADVPYEHLEWAAQAILDYRPDVIVHLGDHWDMPSLSKHESPGSAFMEGRRIMEDVDAGNMGFDLLVAPLQKELAKKGNKWKPECHFLVGNHEARISRAVKDNPKLEGFLSLEMLQLPEPFIPHPFLEIVEIDGVSYSHYFSNIHSGKAIGGSIDNRLNRIGKSFVQGHQQGLLYGVRQFPGKLARHGLVAGSFYLHDEHYRDAQSNGEWRGICVLNEVRDGNYDVMPLSMDYLRRKYG